MVFSSVFKMALKHCEHGRNAAILWLISHFILSSKKTLIFSAQKTLLISGVLVCRPVQAQERAGRARSSSRWGSFTAPATQTRTRGASPNWSTRTSSQPCSPWSEPWRRSRSPTNTSTTRYLRRSLTWLLWSIYFFLNYNFFLHELICFNTVLMLCCKHTMPTKTTERNFKWESIHFKCCI